ncbi:MAG: hypothetical protein ACE5PV_10370 [Candidatus Poribacteria bacterium]
MEISEFQKIIEEIYFELDSQRGVDKTFIFGGGRLYLQPGLS